jgi:hypothetical protein
MIDVHRTHLRQRADERRTAILIETKTATFVIREFADQIRGRKWLIQQQAVGDK